MHKQILESISRCSICNSYKPAQQKEPLVGQKIPTRPWQSISAVLFELNGTDYLVTFDRYFELDVLVSKTSKEVIAKLKPHFARYGLPDRLITDNGPQFDYNEFQNFSKDYQFGTSKRPLGTPSPMEKRKTVSRQLSLP